MKIWQPNRLENLIHDDPGQEPRDYAQVISGAQIGADIAALRAAKACGLATGGTMPKGYRTLIGPLDPELVEFYGLQEHSWSSAYPPRTESNVVASDGTIRFAYNFDSAGEKCTLRYIKAHRLPHFDVKITTDFNIDPWEWYLHQVVKWIYNEEIEILNVAGNANVEIEPLVERFLVEVFQALARKED